MGKGIAALTFDKDYQKKRRDALNKRPTNIQEGIARSGKGLVMVKHIFIHPEILFETLNTSSTRVCLMV